MIYAIIALAVLAVLAAWLVWRCLTLRGALEKSRARCRELQKDRAIRQNLQHVLDRREAEIRRLRTRVTAFENDYQEMQSRASDLNMSLFRESGLRILAEKEEGANRLKLEQLEKQVDDGRRKLKEREAQAERSERQLREVIARQEAEINRLRTANARRLAKKAQQDNGGLDQVTLDDILGRAQ